MIFLEAYKMEGYLQNFAKKKDEIYFPESVKSKFSRRNLRKKTEIQNSRA